MNRDEFSKQTVNVLSKRVGVRCSNPTCRKLTTGPRTDSRHIVNIGVAAHITAATEGGPRFDGALSTEQRQSPDNGIWLCQNCAKLIDNDPARYTVDLLASWKKVAEAAALTELEGGKTVPPPDTSAELEIRYKVRSRTPARHDYQLEVVLANRGAEPLGEYHLDVEIPQVVRSEPGNDYQYVADRSSHKCAFFRVDSQRHRPRDVIYPGDERLVWSINYFIDEKLFWNRGDLFDQPVRATLYRRGFQPIVIELRLGDLQQF